MQIDPQPLTKEAFAPYGDVIDIPTEAGRQYYEDALGNLRAEARPSLSLSLKADTPDRPLRAELLERHEFSSQSFVPIDVARWLIVVAPHAASGGPDTSAVRAFIEARQPDVAVVGHIHEGRGADHVGRTLVLNAGALRDGGYVVIDDGGDGLRAELRNFRSGRA